MTNAPKFPFLTLLISGGHTLLLLAKSSTSFKILATTSDESIGRSFDKVSRMLGLNWTACGLGAALEQFSAEDDSQDDCTPDPIPPFPRPMPGRMAFSYASFHSHVERYIFGRGGADKISMVTKRSIARAFQEAAVIQLLDKLSLGLEWCQTRDIRIGTVVVSGGVASNLYLRDR
jgi:N6-L-threonylcarbamoyladenine synthase